VLPRRSGVPVAITTPEIHHLAAVAIDGHGGPNLMATAEIASEGVGDPPVTLVHVAADGIGRGCHFLRHGLLPLPNEGSRAAPDGTIVVAGPQTDCRISNSFRPTRHSR